MYSGKLLGRIPIIPRNISPQKNVTKAILPALGVRFLAGMSPVASYLSGLNRTLKSYPSEPLFALVEDSVLGWFAGAEHALDPLTPGEGTLRRVVLRILKERTEHVEGVNRAFGQIMYEQGICASIDDMRTNPVDGMILTADTNGGRYVGYYDKAGEYHSGLMDNILSMQFVQRNGDERITGGSRGYGWFNDNFFGGSASQLFGIAVSCFAPGIGRAYKDGLRNDMADEKIPFRAAEECIRRLNGDASGLRYPVDPRFTYTLAYMHRADRDTLGWINNRLKKNPDIATLKEELQGIVDSAPQASSADAMPQLPDEINPRTARIALAIIDDILRCTSAKTLDEFTSRKIQPFFHRIQEYRLVDEQWRELEEIYQELNTKVIVTSDEFINETSLYADRPFRAALESVRLANGEKFRGSATQAEVAFALSLARGHERGAGEAVLAQLKSGKSLEILSASGNEQEQKFIDELKNYNEFLEGLRQVNKDADKEIAIPRSPQDMMPSDWVKVGIGVAAVAVGAGLVLTFGAFTLPGMFGILLAFAPIVVARTIWKVLNFVLFTPLAINVRNAFERIKSLRPRRPPAEPVEHTEEAAAPAPVKASAVQEEDDLLESLATPEETPPEEAPHPDDDETQAIPDLASQYPETISLLNTLLRSLRESDGLGVAEMDAQLRRVDPMLLAMAATDVLQDYPVRVQALAILTMIIKRGNPLSIEAENRLRSGLETGEIAGILAATAQGILDANEQLLVSLGMAKEEVRTDLKPAGPSARGRVGLWLRKIIGVFGRTKNRQEEPAQDETAPVSEQAPAPSADEAQALPASDLVEDAEKAQSENRPLSDDVVTGLVRALGSKDTPKALILRTVDVLAKLNGNIPDPVAAVISINNCINRLTSIRNGVRPWSGDYKVLCDLIDDAIILILAIRKMPRAAIGQVLSDCKDSRIVAEAISAPLSEQLKISSSVLTGLQYPAPDEDETTLEAKALEVRNRITIAINAVAGCPAAERELYEARKMTDYARDLLRDNLLLARLEPLLENFRLAGGAAAKINAARELLGVRENSAPADIDMSFRQLSARLNQKLNDANRAASDRGLDVLRRAKDVLIRAAKTPVVQNPRSEEAALQKALEERKNSMEAERSALEGRGEDRREAVYKFDPAGIARLSVNYLNALGLILDPTRPLDSIRLTTGGNDLSTYFITFNTSDGQKVEAVFYGSYPERRATNSRLLATCGIYNTYEISTLPDVTGAMAPKIRGTPLTNHRPARDRRVSFIDQRWVAENFIINMARFARGREIVFTRVHPADMLLDEVTGNVTIIDHAYEPGSMNVDNNAESVTAEIPENLPDIVRDNYVDVGEITTLRNYIEEWDNPDVRREIIALFNDEFRRADSILKSNSDAVKSRFEESVRVENPAITAEGLQRAVGTLEKGLTMDADGMLIEIYGEMEHGENQDFYEEMDGPRDRSFWTQVLRGLEQQRARPQSLEPESAARSIEGAVLRAMAAGEISELRMPGAAIKVIVEPERAPYTRLVIGIPAERATQEMLTAVRRQLTAMGRADVLVISVERDMMAQKLDSLGVPFGVILDVDETANITALLEPFMAQLDVQALFADYSELKTIAVSGLRLAVSANRTPNTVNRTTLLKIITDSRLIPAVSALGLDSIIAKEAREPYPRRPVNKEHHTEQAVLAENKHRGRSPKGHTRVL
ncbi:MAG: hypothetical protein ABH885_08560, partial [Candidatus Omnitrophota bacterium]